MTTAPRPDVRVRSAESRDVARVGAIERLAFSDPWSDAAFLDLVGRPGVLFDVAVREGGAPADVLGYVVVYLMGVEADLANVAVAPQSRRDGVGRALVRHAIRSARAQGVLELFLEVRESNEAARTLYLDEGFAEVGRRLRYYVRPVENALILRRALR